MRILHTGNPVSGYVMTRELRKRGIEADLLIEKFQIEGSFFSINNPLDYDKSVEEFPDWMKVQELKPGFRKLSIIKSMRKYDLIHAYQSEPVNAMLSGKPYVAQSVGDDLRKYAFRKSISGYLLRRAYRKADQFVYVWPILKPLVEKLGIKNVLYLPRQWDAQHFSREKIKKSEEKTLRIFISTVEWWALKGNDKFLRAFARLCKEKENVFLYYVDWGEDSSKARALLSSPEVKEKVEIIPGPIAREKMAEYMEKSDILVEQFNSGSFTRMGIEAFSFGIPVLINLDEGLHKSLHGDYPPVINAKNEEEIYSKLKQFSNSKDSLYQMAVGAQKWVQKHFDLQKNVDRYIEIYENILRR